MSRTATEAERYRKEAEDRANKIADRDKANVEAFRRRTSGLDTPVKAAEERGSVETNSAQQMVKQAGIGEIQLDRMREARAAERAAERAKAERAPRDERTSARKFADKYDPEIEV